MSRIIVFLIISLCFFLLLKSQGIWELNRARRRGLYPKDNKNQTLFDVRRLLQKGERELAINVYCRIFKTTRAESSRAIAELERSIKGKDLEIE